MSSENTLRTLKDFIFKVDSDGNVCNLDELKAEAIKWVKNGKGIGNNDSRAINRWIKHFFNITEEDLK